MENYKKIGPGHLFQNHVTGPLPDYSSNYSKSRYDTYSTNDAMSKLRFMVLEDNIGNFKSVLDFGYGNGAFMRYCQKFGKTVYGYDISDYPVPDGCQKVETANDVEVDVITFFDSLEHIVVEHLCTGLELLKTKYVCISVPWYHEERGEEWFQNWKHRRENEHFHHFDSHGLVALLNKAGYKVIRLSNVEDKVRTPVDHLPNILTVIAQKI